MIGPHLMLDAYGCERSALEDLERIGLDLGALAERLGLSPVRAPYVYRYAGKTPEDWGISGLVLFKGGRLSVHTFPQKAFLSLDLFTGAKFDVEAIERFVVDRFHASNVEKSVLMRDRSKLADAP